MVGLSYFAKNKELPLFYLDSTKEVCLVVDNSVSLSGESVDCGSKKFVYMSKEEALEAVSNTNFDAIQFYLEDITLEDIINDMKAEKVSTQEVENVEIIYCYTPLFADSIIMNGKKVNMQIVIKDKEIIAGFPLILTGY